MDEDLTDQERNGWLLLADAIQQLRFLDLGDE